MSTLEWVVAVGGGAIAPFLLVGLIGCCIPRRHTVVRSVILKQNPNAVWDSIKNFERIPGWWPPCVMMERLPNRDGHAVYRETLAYARSKQLIELEVTESVQGTRLVTRISEVKGPFRGEWIYELSPAEQGSCKLTITEHGEVGNAFVRALFRLMMDKAQFVESYLGCLSAKFGEKVAILATDGHG